MTAKLQAIKVGSLKKRLMFKTDDDTFVNPEQLWSSLEHSLLHSATTKSLLPFYKRSMISHEVCKNFAFCIVQHVISLFNYLL